MTITLDHPIPKLSTLPATLPLEGAVRIELQQGVLIFRASTSVQERIEMLLQKQQTSEVTEMEAQELAQYEEIDDHLNLVNRVIRNLIQTQ
jgi:Tfp pilus assembly protein PilN